MSDQPEPLSAIIAEMRDLADHRAADAGGERPAIELLRSFADRIEAAAERERAGTIYAGRNGEMTLDECIVRCDNNSGDNPRGRDVAQIGGWLRELRERRNAPGNASSCAPMSLDEAIKHAEERADGSPCGQAHAQLAGWLRELRDLRRAHGNAAELREALIYVRDLMRRVRDGDRISSLAFLGVVEHALAAPARNVDRFATAVEAMEEWGKYPQSRYKGCRLCPHGDASMVSPAHLTLAEWLFAPAKGGDHA